MTQVCCIQDPFLQSLIALFPSLTISFSCFLFVTINKWCSLGDDYKTLRHHARDVKFFQYLATPTGTHISHPACSLFDLTTLHRMCPTMQKPPSSPPCEPGRSFLLTLACLSSPNCCVNKDENAHILELPTVMDRCLSCAVTCPLENNKAKEDDEFDTGEVVDEPPDEVDSEAVPWIVDSISYECPNEIDHVTNKRGNVESRSVDGDTDGSDDCLAATWSPPPTHRCKKSWAGTTNNSAMTWSIVATTHLIWLQCSEKVIQSIISASTTTKAWLTPRGTQKIFRPSVSWLTLQLSK